MGSDAAKSGLSLGEDSKSFFRQSLREALEERKIETYPFVEMYLVDLLNHYLLATNLFSEEEMTGKRTRETLAEMMLRAATASQRQRYDLLKKLGDSSLYISGFFADSFQRKIIDVDYYIEMGASAYSSLSREANEDTFARMYLEIAQKFNLFVDVFMLMGRKTMSAEPDNILRLMEVHAKTGSTLAQDILIDKGIFPGVQQSKPRRSQ
jgi:hypothetical protein